MPADIAKFQDWYETRVLRRTGRGPAPSTLRAKGSRLRTLLDITGSPDLVAFATLVQDRDGVETVLDGLAARMTSGSAVTAYYALSDFGEYAKAMGWVSGIALLPSDCPPSNPQKPIVIYTDDEVELILGNARGKGLRWWMFLSTVAHTGRRVGEILSVEWNWLNTSAETPNFHLPNTKNGKQAYVPLSRVLREEVYTDANIEALRSERRTGANRVFSRDPHEYPFPWTYTSVFRMFGRYCEGLGVEPRGFHCLRHTKATNLLAKGVPLQAVSALLGHANVATTDRIYNHANALAYSQYID